MSAAAAMQPQVVSTEKYGVATIDKREGGLVHITNEAYPDGVWVSKKDLGNARPLDALGLKVQAIDLSVLQEEALSLWAKDQASAGELGHALIAVREKMFQLGRGSFTKWYRQKKLAENRVNYCIRLAEGKVKKRAKDVSPSPTAQLEKGLADSLRNSLRPYSDSESGRINYCQEAIRVAFTGVVQHLYMELAGVGVLHDPNIPNAPVEHCLQQFYEALSKLLESAYQTREATTR